MGEFDGRRVTLMGLGRFGGGVGVARWLCARGARVLVTDLDPAERLRDSIDAIGDLVRAGEVDLRLGGHDERDFRSTDLVVANPGVARPWDNRFLIAARESGVPIATEIGLLVERLPSRERVIGVTGSNGKSTTTAMVGSVLGGAARREGERGAGQLARGSGRVHVGGNLGGSLLGELGRIAPEDWVVLELSSAMLCWLGGQGTESPGWSPAIAGVTNLTPNHLDWHGSFQHYAASKQAILRFQRPGDAAVLGPGLESFATRPGVGRLGPDATRAAPRLAAPGRHNVANARLAVAIACATGVVDAEAGWACVAGFAGLPHRLERVAEHAGVVYVNDSKATTPEAANLAIEAVRDGFDGRVHLIAGGFDKGTDVEGWAAALRGRAQVYAIGATGERIARRSGGTLAGTLARAVAAAAERARPGDVVLLSPGCASWDQYVNFEARGDEFRRLARGLA